MKEQLDVSEKFYYDPLYAWLIELPDIKRMDRFQAKLLLKSKYHSIYGICNHDVVDPKVPYPYAAIHPLEDRREVSRKARRMQQFVSERIHHHTGITWLEFQKMPYHEVERLIKSCEQQNKAEDSQAGQVQGEMQKLMREINKTKTSAPVSPQIYVPPHAKR